MAFIELNARTPELLLTSCWKFAIRTSEETINAVNHLRNCSAVRFGMFCVNFDLLQCCARGKLVPLAEWMTTIISRVERANWQTGCQLAPGIKKTTKPLNSLKRRKTNSPRVNCMTLLRHPICGTLSRRELNPCHPAHDHVGLMVLIDTVRIACEAGSMKR